MGKLKVVLKGRFDDANETRNIFHCTTDSDDAADNVNAAAEWISEYVDAIRPATSEHFRYYGMEVYEQIGLADDWNLIGTVTFTGATGTAPGTYNANQDAAVMIGKTGIPKTVGKKFAPAITDAGQADSTIQAGAMATLVSVLAIWITEFVSTGTVTVTPAIFKKLSGAFAPIVGGIVDLLVGSQRRRKPGVGS